MKPELNQFWQDTVTRDVLKILSFSMEAIDLVKFDSEDPSTYTDYVRCACFPRGESFFGIQEMKTSRLDGVRFIQVGRLKTLWYRWKLRNEK